MIASLMMYKRPQLEGAHERYWALIRKHLSAAGIDSPQLLAQDAEEFSVWTHPQLVLSQTCGMPYRTRLHENVSLIGTPDFGLDGCPPGHYRSAIVIRKSDERRKLSDFKDAMFAYNQTFSQSGYAAPYWHTEPHGFWFENQFHAQQHLNSAESVALGHADIASLDAVSWRLMCEYEPFADQLRVLEWTKPTPGLPYISAAQANQPAIFTAVEKAIQELSVSDRKGLGLKCIVYIESKDYLAIPNPPQA